MSEREREGYYRDNELETERAGKRDRKRQRYSNKLQPSLRLKPAHKLKGERARKRESERVSLF